MKFQQYKENWGEALELISDPVNNYQTLRGSGINAPASALMVAFTDLIIICRAIVGKGFDD